MRVTYFDQIRPAWPLAFASFLLIWYLFSILIIAAQLKLVNDSDWLYFSRNRNRREGGEGSASQFGCCHLTLSSPCQPDSQSGFLFRPVSPTTMSRSIPDSLEFQACALNQSKSLRDRIFRVKALEKTFFPILENAVASDIVGPLPVTAELFDCCNVICAVVLGRTESIHVFISEW